MDADGPVAAYSLCIESYCFNYMDGKTGFHGERTAGDRLLYARGREHNPPDSHLPSFIRMGNYRRLFRDASKQRRWPGCMWG